jgi:hypothetical protein
MGTPWAKRGSVGPLVIAWKPSRIAIGRQTNGTGANRVVTVYAK